MGWRIGAVRSLDGSLTSIVLSFVLFFMLLFAVFIAFGIWVLIRGDLLGFEAVGIGYLGFSSSLTHHRFFKAPSEDTKTWMEHHGTSLGGAFIASVTAFSAAVLTNYFKQIPEFIVWLAPILLLIPVLNKQVKEGEGSINLCQRCSYL